MHVGEKIPEPQESTVCGMGTSAHGYPGHPVPFMSQGFQGYVSSGPDLKRPPVV